MREITVTLAGEEIELAATFKASMEVAKKVGDPLFIASEAALEAQLVGSGMPYNPKWRATIENVPVILHIGQKAAGGDRSLEDMQNLVFDNGFLESREVAFRYLALMTTTHSEEMTGEGGEGSGK